MNDFSPCLRQAAEEIRTLRVPARGGPPPAPAQLEPWAVRLERAADLSSGRDLQQEVFALAQSLTESEFLAIEDSPSFQEAFGLLLQRWQRANGCCRR